MAGLAGAGGAGGGPLGGLGSLLAGKGLVAIVAGLLVGAGSGGALVASGAVHFGGGSAANAASGSQISLVACPDQGPVIGHVAAGEQVLVTGRTDDSAWLELYYPAPGISRAWTPAGPLQLQGDLTSLPVHACDALSPSPSPSLIAEVSPSPELSPSPEVSPSPELSPSPEVSPSPSPAPSPTPNVGPKLASLAASTKTLYYDPSSYCPKGSAETATFSVTASDANGVSSVALFWKEPGGSYNQRAMSKSGSKWSATLSSAKDSINTAGTLAYYVQATDSQGASSKLPGANAFGIAVKVCPNTGPTITAVHVDSTTLDTNPLGTGVCNGNALGTGISLKATDVDGIDQSASSTAVMLFFTGPGLSGYTSRAFSFSASGIWNSFIMPRDDGITGTGTISWYATAKDSKGATTRTPAKGTYSISVHRCDTTASIGGGIRQTTLTFCPQPPQNTTTVFVTFNMQLGDPDGLTSATLAYTIHNTGTRLAPPDIQGRVTYKGSGGAWNPTSVAFDGGTYFGSNTVSWTITTTDRYGGHTTMTFSSKIFVSVC